MRPGNGPSSADLPPVSPRTPATGEAGPAARARRFDRLDALRGFALIWMAVFHFCFDLSNWRLIDANFYSDPRWTVQRTCILSLFLLCAGAGQAVATAQGQRWQRFWRRWAQIAACAVLVSFGSWLMFPRSYIYFGVLHGMAVMLVIARLSAQSTSLRRWLWPLGLAAIALPRLVQDPFFDTRLLNWTGFVTHKPITEDYVPVLPWLGVMWWGMAATQWLLAHRPGWLAWAVSSDNHASAGMGAGAWHRVRHALATLGRWSLSFYMLHQPLLIGALAGWMTLTGRPIPA